MISYVQCIGFIALYITFCFIVGSAYTKGQQDESYSFVSGYLIFAFFIALGGIPVQLLNINWWIFAIYLILLILFLLGLSIYRIRKYQIVLFPEGFKEFVKKHWVLLVVAIVVTLVSLLYYQIYWLNNGLDDGFYINKMASYPYYQNADVYPSTGLVANRFDFFTYQLNVYEIESSVYIYFANIMPTVFARFGLAFINYFLFTNVIYVFAKKIMSECNKYNIQFVSIIAILFGFSMTFLNDYNLMNVQDSWQYITAMFFGSSIVRTMGAMLILYPFIEKKEVNIFDILKVIGIAIVLVSKSTVAVPVIFITCISYLIYILVIRKDNWRLLSLGIIALLLIAGFIIGDNSLVVSGVNNSAINNITKIIPVLGLIVMFIGVPVLKNRVYNVSVAIVMLMLCLMYVPIINNIFEAFAEYDFVGARTLTMVIYFIIILAIITIVSILSRESNKVVVKNIVACGCIIGLLGGSLGSYNSSEGDLRKSMSLFIENNQLAPYSVIELSKKLNTLNDKDGQLYTMMPEGLIVAEHQYSLGTAIRQFSPEIINPSVTFRFLTSEDPLFNGYTFNNQKILDDFIVNKDQASYDKLAKVLKKYPINCIVLLNCDNVSDYLKNSGFDVYDEYVCQDNRFTIYYKK